MQLDQKRTAEIVEGFQGKNIVIIGDLMLDEYLSGKVTRISPEAPVPIVEIDHEFIRLGGAANVALNLAALGCSPRLIGLCGEDAMAIKLLELLEESHIEGDGLVRSQTRPTTIKTRIIGDNQHIARVDKEITAYADESERKALKARIDLLLRSAEAVIIEDYNKGVLTPGVIEYTTQQCRLNDIPVFVDPKFTNFMLYKGVTLFKPNVKEAQQALARSFDNEEHVRDAGEALRKTLHAENILLTRGSRGMSLFEKNGDVTHIPTKARKVADVSGAGDTVIGTLTAAFCGGATMREASILANIAAGVVVEEVGIIPITRQGLLDAGTRYDEK